jgi:hypothetical protein
VERKSSGDGDWLPYPVFVEDDEDDEAEKKMLVEEETEERLPAYDSSKSLRKK